MSFWQLGACVDGVNAANGAETKATPMSNAEFDDLLKVHGISIH